MADKKRQEYADAFRKCTGSVEVTVTDRGQTAISARMTDEERDVHVSKIIEELSPLTTMERNRVLVELIEMRDHWFNTQSVVDALVESLKDAAGGRRLEKL